MKPVNSFGAVQLMVNVERKERPIVRALLLLGMPVDTLQRLVEETPDYRRFTYLSTVLARVVIAQSEASDAVFSRY